MLFNSNKPHKSNQALFFWLKSNLTTPKNLVFADLRWFNFSPRCSDVQVYFGTP